MTAKSDYRSRAQTARRWQIRFGWMSVIVFQALVFTLSMSRPSFHNVELTPLDRAISQFLTRDDLEDVLHGLEQRERSATSKAEQRKLRDQIDLVNSLLSIIQNRPSGVTGDTKDPHLLQHGLMMLEHGLM